MGHDLLLDAWAKVRAGVPDATLVVIGEGPLRATLEQRAADLGVAGSVRFLCSDDARFVTGVVLHVDGGLGM